MTFKWGACPAPRSQVSWEGRTGEQAACGRRPLYRGRRGCGPRTARAVPGSRGAYGVNGLSGLVHRAAVGRQWCIVVTRSPDL